MKRLFAFCGFPHDPQRVLTAVHQLALVSIELRPNIGAWRGKAGLELGIAGFADSNNRRDSFYKSQLPFRHESSFPQAT